MSRPEWRRRKEALLLVMALLAAGLGVLAYATHLLQRSELQTIDARFSIRGTRPAPSDLVVVEIDNATLQELARHHLHSEFPFPRAYTARVIDRLRQDGAKVIAVDMQFTQETDPRDDNALIEAVGRAHGKIVLATTEVGAHGSTDVLGGNQLLAQIGARPASARLTLDTDGVIRRFSHADRGLGSFAVVGAETATHRSVPASRFAGGTLPIDFPGPPRTIKSVSYSKVLAGEYASGTFRDKIVIVGASAPILQDVHATATTSGATMPGSEVWAAATSTLLRGAPLTHAPRWLNILMIALLGAVAPLGSLRVHPRRALLYAVAAAVVFTIGVQVAFNNGWILSFVYPLLALVLATLATLAVLYMSEAIERQRVRDVFKRFVPSDVVEEVLARADENLRLGAVERDCTVLFSDLRSFTSFSEGQPAERVLDVVNHYLSEMSDAILAAGGTLIAYMGDGIMAIFGAPLEQTDHADRALTAAIDMTGPRLARFNSWLAEQGLQHTFTMGVGINSGMVMAGNVGSEQRVEYTAIGDTTNTASRLEGMTKGTEHMLFIADSTRERLRDPPAALRLVGEFEVRGRDSAIGVWTVADSRPA
jgi:adenylate cyclase